MFLSPNYLTLQDIIGRKKTKMLNRNMHRYLYEVDASQGTTPPPDTQQENQNGTKQEGEKLHTAQEVSRIASSEAKKAKAKAESAMLEALGVTSLDEVKTILDAKRQKEESEKSEVQKLSELVQSLQKQMQEKDAKLSESERRSRLGKRDSEVKALLSKAHNPNEVLILLKAHYGAKMDELISEDGAFDATAATTLIAEYQKQNAHHFKDERQGSVMSNSGGRIPSPDKDRRKAVERKLSKTIQGF